ncbi:hypothetical protein AX15_001976 [Amanita polypyramis BW_CC]|nr:hypothetical protein AX15_001976 [Amanita polypyramis BW_CC]
MGHSSSSSSDSDSDHSQRKKQHKKKFKHHEKKHHGDSHHSPSLPYRGGLASSLIGGILGGRGAGHVPATPQYKDVPSSQHSGTYYDSSKPIPQPASPPPSYSPNPQPAPPSGHRIPLGTSTPFPSVSELGPPPFFEADRKTPIYIGSALFDRSVHPCKVGEHLQPHALVPYGGQEYGHSGRYDLLPFIPELMVFVPTSHGHIPPGRRPVEGGYEGDGDNLYHAAAVINGLRVPGKAGKHLGGCRIGYGGHEHSITENYEILCWR